MGKPQHFPWVSSCSFCPSLHPNYLSPCQDLVTVTQPQVLRGDTWGCTGVCCCQIPNPRLDIHNTFCGEQQCAGLSSCSLPSVGSGQSGLSWPWGCCAHGCECSACVHPHCLQPCCAQFCRISRPRAPAQPQDPPHPHHPPWPLHPQHCQCWKGPVIFIEFY